MEDKESVPAFSQSNGSFSVISLSFMLFSNTDISNCTEREKQQERETQQEREKRREKGTEREKGGEGGGE